MEKRQFYWGYKWRFTRGLTVHRALYSPNSHTVTSTNTGSPTARTRGKTGRFLIVVLFVLLRERSSAPDITVVPWQVPVR
jgi:hypothetical protein